MFIWNTFTVGENTFIIIIIVTLTIGENTLPGQARAAEVSPAESAVKHAACCRPDKLNITGYRIIAGNGIITSVSLTSPGLRGRPRSHRLYTSLT